MGSRGRARYHGPGALRCVLQLSMGASDVWFVVVFPWLFCGIVGCDTGGRPRRPASRHLALHPVVARKVLLAMSDELPVGRMVDRLDARDAGLEGARVLA